MSRTAAEASHLLCEGPIRIENDTLTVREPHAAKDDLRRIHRVREVEIALREEGILVVEADHAMGEDHCRATVYLVKQPDELDVDTARTARWARLYGMRG